MPRELAQPVEEQPTPHSASSDADSENNSSDSSSICSAYHSRGRSCAPFRCSRLTDTVCARSLSSASLSFAAAIAISFCDGPPACPSAASTFRYAAIAIAWSPSFNRKFAAEIAVVTFG